tara:strand:- start:206 stop:2017 length:1812 start_codon:yes stop_codon:yes gene_type:complete
MENKFKNNLFFLFIFFLIFIFHQILFQNFFPNNEGYLGHDFEQFVPNLIFGKIWFENNFISIPWFTPSFCCGIPFYADPQSTFYSIYQLIFILFDPIISIKLVFFLLSFFSYFGMFLLIRKFGFSKYSGLLCASLFLFNGFFVYRSIIGHVAYLSYIFVPLYCFILIKSYEKKTYKSIIFYLLLSSIIFANFFHSGSGPILLIILSSIFFIVLLYAHFQNSIKIFFNFFISLLLGISISLSKITSSLFLLSNFPREYPPTEFNSFLAYIKNFFNSFFLEVDQKYFNESLISMISFGRHEMEYSLSIVPIISLFLIVLLDKKYLKINFKNFNFLIILAIIFLVPVYFNLNFLNQYNFNSQIPIIKSTWVQFRWMAIYIIPIIFLTGLLIENIKINQQYKNYISIVFILILLSQNFIKDNTSYLKSASYNIQDSFDFNEKFEGGQIKPKINGPSVLLNKDGTIKKISTRNDAFYFSYSPLMCYQSLFGYNLEKLNKKNIKFYSKRILSDGSILYYTDINKNKKEFTFFKPYCFLFPDENNCLPGDVFESDEFENMVNFLNYEKIDFKQNKIQIISNYISLFSFIFSFAYIIYYLINCIFKLRKNN